MLADYCAEVDWNILGNYIMTVRNTKRTIMSSLPFQPACLAQYYRSDSLNAWHSSTNKGSQAEWILSAARLGRIVIVFGQSWQQII